MYGIERQEKILSLLSENVSISVAKLSKLLYVSQPTVRRDLNELERQKKVIRTHGGVVIRNAPDNEIPLLWREEQNNASKKKIAEKAAEYIHNGDIIFMDASSTVSYIIPHLKAYSDIIVVTNSPKISLKLGYTEDGFITDSSIEESCVKKAMLKNAAKSFYLCDSSKKNQKYMYNICATNEVTVITDTSV